MSNQIDQSKQELDKLYCYGTKILELIDDDITNLELKNNHLNEKLDEANSKYNNLKQNLKGILDRAE